MFGKKTLFVLIASFSLSWSFAVSQPVELVDGSYGDNSGQNSLIVTGSGDNVTLELQNGSKINFALEGAVYKTEKLSGESHFSLKIIGDKKFEIIDGSTNESVGSYTLFATPSLFKKLLSILVSSALIFAIIQAYLKVNKIWKRRKNVEVANSISIVAAMLGFAV